jgi:hypothetical protein
MIIGGFDCSGNTVEKTESTITIRGWRQRYVWHSGCDVEGFGNDATADEILQHCYPQLVEVVERPTLINRLLALIPGNEWRKEHRTVAKVARGWHREKKREFMCYEFPRGSVVFKHSTAEVAIG